MKHLIRLLCLAYIALAAPALAQAPHPELSCMAATYEADTLDHVERFSGIDDKGADEFRDQVFTIATTAVQTCASKGKWPASAVESATNFEAARLVEAALRRGGPLSREQLAQLDLGLALHATTSFWAHLEDMFSNEGANDERAMSEEVESVFEHLVVWLGVLDNDRKPEAIGEILGMMAMQRKSAREFQAAQAKNP